MSKINSIFSFILLASVGLIAWADERPIQMHDKGSVNNHSGIPFVPADMPQVYYDSETGVITVDGTGYASYYYVDIVSQSTLSVVLYDTVDGDYGTVDVSSLPDDNYQIIITSSHNNEYTGYFTNH